MTESSSQSKNHNQRLFLLLAWIGIFVAFIFHIAEVSPRASRLREQAMPSALPNITTVGKNPTAAEKVAVIDNGVNSTAGSQRVEETLNRLSARFSDSHAQMAARAMAAQKILRSKGIQRSLSDILADVEHITEGGTAGVSYSEVLAAYVTLAGR